MRILTQVKLKMAQMLCLYKNSSHKSNTSHTCQELHRKLFLSIEYLYAYREQLIC